MYYVCYDLIFLIDQSSVEIVCLRSLVSLKHKYVCRFMPQMCMSTDAYSLIRNLDLRNIQSLVFSPWTMPQDYLAWWLLAVPSPPGRAAAPVSTVLPAAMESRPVHRTCYLSQTCCFQLSRDSRSGRDTLNDRLWKANWHLLLRCWPVAPLTTTVIIIIWPYWSSMNIWTSWPCSVIISTRHSQKRTGHPS